MTKGLLRASWVRIDDFGCSRARLGEGFALAGFGAWDGFLVEGRWGPCRAG